MSSWLSCGEKHVELYKATAVPQEAGSFPACSAWHRVTAPACCQVAGAEEGNPQAASSQPAQTFPLLHNSLNQIFAACLAYDSRYLHGQLSSDRCWSAMQKGFSWSS